MRAFSVCHDCPDREIGCHGRCERYQEEVAERKQEMERLARLKVTANDTWQVRRNNRQGQR